MVIRSGCGSQSTSLKLRSIQRTAEPVDSTGTDGTERFAMLSAIAERRVSSVEGVIV